MTWCLHDYVHIIIFCPYTFFDEMFIMIFVHFIIGNLFSYCWGLSVLCITFIRYKFCPKFPLVWLVFSFSWQCPSTQVSNFTCLFYLILIKFIIYIVYCDCGVSKMFSPYSRTSEFSLMLSSRSFKILYHAFRFMINFELIFLKNINLCLHYFFLFFSSWMCSFSRIFVKYISFSAGLPLFFGQRSVNDINVSWSIWIFIH